MAGVRQIKVKAEDDGLRLDRWFRKHFPALTQGRLEKLLRRGLVRLDGKRVKAAERVAKGHTVRVPPEVPPQGAAKSERPVSVSDAVVERLRNAILHKDKDVIVLNKPSGLAVQGAVRRPLISTRLCRPCNLMPPSRHVWCIASTAIHRVCCCWRATAKRHNF